MSVPREILELAGHAEPETEVERHIRDFLRDIGDGETDADRAVIDVLSTLLDRGAYRIRKRPGRKRTKKPLKVAFEVELLRRRGATLSLACEVVGPRFSIEPDTAERHYEQYKNSARWSLDYFHRRFPKYFPPPFIG